MKAYQDSKILERGWLQYLIVFIITAFISLIISKINYVIITLLILFVVYKFRIKTIPLIITLLLILVSDINSILRNAVTFGGMLVITYFFIKEYGLMYIAYPKFPKLISLYLIFVFFVLLVSSVFSPGMMISFTELFRFTSFIIIIYFLYSLLIKPDDIYGYMYSLVAAGLILSFSILFNFFYADVHVFLFQKGILQEGGIMKNVSAAGGMLAVSIPLSFSFIFASPERKKKNIFIALFIIQVIAILLTNSRAAILAVVISLGYIHYHLAKKYLKRTILTLALLFLTLFIIVPNVFDLVLLYLRVDRVFENTRYYLWDIAIDIFKDHPLNGAGPGMFKIHIYEYLPVRLNGWDEQQIEWIYLNAGIGHAHNFFLFYLSELGIPGFFAALFLPILFVSFSYKTARLLADNPSLKAVSTGITGMGIGLFVRSFFESTGLLTYGWITRDLPFWVCFIVILFLYKYFTANTRIDYNQRKFI